ncbi:hypothetical protein HBH56_204460 [Parastagonospora nodorum]|uniref:Uncharacterized protein n=1 Tax=Phaeosphaeria nodorum (strain SN15 / ATCC MYA-4574 / FGSC 10173) TaxID=321614 RepID=A0A7U2FAF0_PHANO|nr:hypothetical protein HBH56_204460 [Parastagonospora nodorum]QRD01667.1 hypothetical protein JI435_145870 [Parastagonospora nodorum SN15]KAH3923942.1 hypothetical protein HBH54_203340 [Parastagonospora nodorum]KAH4013797.1 hypothetical protein HBI09_214020 [Parastagonospora nodorum]KAH4042825.1 hypothetical protein HBH49_243240 [Parastagonospora nodorum]
MEDNFEAFIPQQLRNLLIALTNACVLAKRLHELEVDHYPSSPIDALSRVLLSGQEQRSPEILQYASTWLCHSLACSVFKALEQGRRSQYEGSHSRSDHLDCTSEEFADLSINHHKQESKGIDELLALFEEIQVTLPNESWPQWAKHPRKFDLRIHVEYLKKLARLGRQGIERENAIAYSLPPARQTSFLQFLGTEMQSLMGLPVTLTQFFKQALQALEREVVWPEYPLKTKSMLQPALFQPENQELYTQFTIMVKSELAWRKDFVTSMGFFGHGPKWLMGRETVMLVCGANVPYVFTPLEVDQRAQANEIRAELDANDEKYYETRN